MNEEFFDDTSLAGVLARVDALLADSDALSDEACDRLWADIGSPELRNPYDFTD